MAILSVLFPCAWQLQTNEDRYKTRRQPANPRGWRATCVQPWSRSSRSYRPSLAYGTDSFHHGHPGPFLLLEGPKKKKAKGPPLTRLVTFSCMTGGNIYILNIPRAAKKLPSSIPLPLYTVEQSSNVCTSYHGVVCYRANACESWKYSCMHEGTIPKSLSSRTSTP